LVVAIVGASAAPTHGALLLFTDQAAKSPEFRTVIRCLTIAIQDVVALNIVLELTMSGRPPRYLDEPITQPTASPFGVEARR
jgi:hypothetical protein